VKVFGDIGDNTKILFIAEAPGEEEDNQGRPFVGASGKLLRLWIKTCGLTEDQFSVLNIVKCRPPNNRKPLLAETSTCGVWIKKQIYFLGCKKIVLLGATACDFFLSPTGFYDGGLLKYVGTTFVVDDYRMFVMPHPSYVLRSGGIYEPPLDEMLRFING
jgi:DNA polymerase